MKESSHPYPEGLRRQSVYQHQRHGAVGDTEYNSGDAEGEGRQMDVHHCETDAVGQVLHHYICAVLYLGLPCIWLQQVIHHQIMDREEHADGVDRHEEHGVVEGVVGASCSVKQRGQPQPQQ